MVLEHGVDCHAQLLAGSWGKRWARIHEIAPALLNHACTMQLPSMRTLGLNRSFLT